MAYSFQTFNVGDVDAAAKLNQTEVNVRDHLHGSSGVVSVTVAALTATTYSGSTLVNANTSSDQNLAVSATSHRYYILSAYIGGAIECVTGVSVTAAEAVDATVHTILVRDGNVTGDVLRIVNGSGTNRTIVWEVRLLN